MAGGCQPNGADRERYWTSRHRLGQEGVSGHGSRRERRRDGAQALASGGAAIVFDEAAEWLCGGDGGVWQRPSLGTAGGAARARGADDESSMVASVGEGTEFRSGREPAAWLGIVPRQRSTGGRTRLLGISKRGDRHLRCLFIHGARSALRTAARRADRRSRWAVEVEERRGTNIAAVALANKNARTAWAVLAREASFDADYPIPQRLLERGRGAGNAAVGIASRRFAAALRTPHRFARLFLY